MPKSPSYPSLSKNERKSAVEFIGKHLDHLDSHPGGARQAIAIGLREAAPQKYESFAKRNKGGGGDKDKPDKKDDDEDSASKKLGNKFGGKQSKPFGKGGDDDEDDDG